MSRKKKIDMDTLLGEMGAVAAFANSGAAETEAADGQEAPESLLSGLVLAPEPTLARERRAIADGKYEVAIGWEAEPAIEGQKNAAAFSIARTNRGRAEPVEGAEQTVTVRLRQGSDTREIRPWRVPGHPGQYAAYFIPTRPGSYAFTLLGTIEGESVDESFDSSSGHFADVEPAASVQFPAPPAGTPPPVLPASDVDATTRALAIAGFGLGFLGALAAWRAWTSRSAHDDSGRQAPVDRSTRGESLGESSGPVGQEEIALTLEPLMTEFRQGLAESIRAQTAEAFRASGFTAS